MKSIFLKIKNEYIPIFYIIDNYLTISNTKMK